MRKHYSVRLGWAIGYIAVGMAVGFVAGRNIDTAQATYEPIESPTPIVTAVTLETIEPTETIEVDIAEEVAVELEANDAVVVEELDPEPYYPLTDSERWAVECLVMGESGGEPYEGQMLVAQCILNAALRDGITPSQVRQAYKYSGWSENVSQSVRNAVSAVFDDGEKVVDDEILYFYAPALCTSSWHETQDFVIEVGGHRFFAEN